jgi:hypothetical protein
VNLTTHLYLIPRLIIRRFFTAYEHLILLSVSQIIQDVPGEVNILGDHSIGHSKQKSVYVMCPIPNGFRDRVISLYSSKIVDKKDILFFLIPVSVVQVTKWVSFTQYTLYTYK